MTSAQIPRIVIDNIANMQGKTIILCDYERLKYFFDVSKDGLKATMYLDAKCKDGTLIRIAKLHIDFSYPDELVLYILDDAKDSINHVRIGWVQKYVVRFKYIKGLPTTEVRRLAVAAAIVAAFYSYAGFKATTKMQRPHRSRHKVIAAAAAYILMRAGFIKPYRYITKGNKIKLIEGDPVMINDEKVYFRLVIVPWKDKRNKTSSILANSLMYLGAIASRIGRGEGESRRNA